MIEGQKDSEAGEVDKGGERTPLLKKEEMKKKKGGRYRNEIVQEKIEQESESDVILTNCRECFNE